MSSQANEMKTIAMRKFLLFFDQKQAHFSAPRMMKNSKKGNYSYLCVASCFGQTLIHPQKKKEKLQND
jgi:hypothetical protein